MRKILLVIIIFNNFLAYSQIEEIKNKESIQWIPIISGFENRRIEFKTDLFVTKGEYVLINKFENELILIYNGIEWHNEKDTVKLKKGNLSLGIRAQPSHFSTHYKVKLTNIDRDENIYLFFQIFAYNLSNDDLLHERDMTIMRDSSKITNKLKIPIIDEYCSIILTSFEGEELFSKMYELPEIPHLDYNKTPMGSYQLMIKTYSRTYKIKLIIKDIFIR